MSADAVQMIGARGDQLARDRCGFSHDRANGAIARPSPKSCASRTARLTTPLQSRCSSGTRICPMASGFGTGNTRMRRWRCRTSCARSRPILDRLDDDEDQVLTIVLDGENAWGGYPDDGRPFLHALYSRLSSDSRLKTSPSLNISSAIRPAGSTPHPVGQLTRVYNLATGSWIDEPGSSPGVDLGTWIGEPEENAAWNLLGLARSAVARTAADAPAVERAHQSLLAAEGSDWFWWFGSDQESRNDAAFDELFRAHLRGAYQALDSKRRSRSTILLSRTRSSGRSHIRCRRIRRRDQVSIRTNCPGRLTYRDRRLTRAGGDPRGSRRRHGRREAFQVTLGPFPASAQRLAFRFYCEHPGCQHESPCCLSGPQAIALGARARAPRRTSAHGSNTQPRGSHADHQ